MNETKSLLEQSMAIRTGDEAAPVYDQEVVGILRLLQDMLVYGAPNVKRQSTNALRNSIRVQGNQIIIGGGDVHYAYDTNANWDELPYRNGLRNHNEGWVDKLVRQGLIIYASKYGYKVVYN